MPPTGWRRCGVVACALRRGVVVDAADGWPMLPTGRPVRCVVGVVVDAADVVADAADGAAFCGRFSPVVDADGVADFRPVGVSSKLHFLPKNNPQIRGKFILNSLPSLGLFLSNSKWDACFGIFAPFRPLRGKLIFEPKPLNFNPKIIPK